jgi:uncharacterized surface protein with fasciclin (FAS1) repeats
MRKHIFSFAALLCLMVGTIGCQKDLDPSAETEAVAANTIAGIITNGYTNPHGNAAARNGSGTKIQFNFLKYALTQTKLMSVLAQDGDYTLFAPSDEAFREAGFNSYEDIRKAPVELLKAILTYHVLDAEVTASQVPAGPNAAITMLSGQKAYVTSNTSGVFINGVSVVSADIMALNGVIHVIDRILMPPVGNIVETAVANPNFSYLVAAVFRASQGSVNVAGVLSSAGPFTVFAPTNAAFIAAGFPTTASIMAADPATLTAILTYHVIGARVFSSDLVDGAMPTMLSGGTTTIDLDAGARIKGTSNTTYSNITQTDIVATNGVIHVIDQVLLP